MWKLASKMVKAFQDITKEYGGMDCKDIARVDWRDIKQVKAFYKDPSSRRTECLKIIEKTVDYLENLMGKYNIKPVSEK